MARFLGKYVEARGKKQLEVIRVVLGETGKGSWRSGRSLMKYARLMALYGKLMLVLITRGRWSVSGRYTDLLCWPWIYGN